MLHLILKKMKFVLFIFGGFFLMYCTASFAAGTTQITLTSIQSHIANTVGSVAQILMDVSTIAGIGFILASLFKFHQHKLNPTQIPLSNGITLLAVGAALTVLPHLLATTTQAVFGVTAISKAGSTGIKTLVVS